nr:hypothetical protein [Tanacetum cinerariifolium]
MTSFEDINDPTKAMNAVLILFAKAFQLTTPTNNNQRTLSNPRNRQIAQPGMNISQDRQSQNIGGNDGNQFGRYAGQVAQNQQRYNAWQNGIANQNGTRNIVVARGEGTGNENQVRRSYSLLKKKKQGFNFKQKNLTSWLLQLDKAPVYDTDGSAEVQPNDNGYDNDIFNMFTQEEQYTDLLEPIPEPQLVPLNDNHVTYVAPSMVQSGGTVETSSAPNEEMHAHQETVYHNLIDQVAQVNMVNCNMRATNNELKFELARYKIQEQRIEISQEKYDKLEKCYQKSVYQEQCLTRKINALHLSSAKQITTLNDEISDLNKQLSKEKSTISSLMEEKKRLKHDFKTREDKYLDKEFDLEAKIKDLENILLKRNQTVQTMHILNPKPNLFFHPDRKMALGYPNPLYLKKAQLKQQSLYKGNLLLEEHDPPAVYDSEETLKLAQESREKMRFLKKEIKQANYAKINHLSGIERLQAQLVDLKGKSSDTPSASNTIDPLNQKLETKIVELEFQMVNYEGTSVTPQVDKPKLIAVTPYLKKLHALIPSHSVPQPREFNVVKHSNVIAPGMFKIDPSQTSRENVSSDVVNSSSIGLVHTTRTRRPQPKGNIRNDRVLSASKSGEAKKNVIVEDHLRNLSLSKNQKTMSSEPNHDACLLSFVNALNSRANNMCANVPPSANQKRPRTQAWKPKQVGFKERLVCTPKPRLPRFSLKWSPSGRSFDLKGKLVAFKETNFPNDDKDCPSNPQKFLGTVRFGNDHIAAILGYGDLKWGNITITRVYFIEGLGHNLFLVGQFCDANLEVAFRKNTCFIRDLDGVDLLKALPICLMARATPTKSWLWHKRLSHLNFDTINDLAKNDLVSGLPKFKYAKEHLCPSCKEGKSKRTSHPPKPVPNSKQWLYLLNMDLCVPMRVASINGKRRVIIVRTDNGTEFKNQPLKEYFDSVGITHETSAAKTPQQNGVGEHRNRTLVEVARTMLIFSHASLFLWAEAIATACYTQNRFIIHRDFNKTPYELIQGRNPCISYLHVFGALCYSKNDREDIGKLGAKGDIGFFIGYSANYVAYKVYNQRTKKIMEMMNVMFDELSTMAFEQNSSKPGLQSLTSGQISFGLELTYAPSTITPQRPSEHDLDILFEPLYNEYLGGQPSEAPRTIPAAPMIQNLQAPTASISIQDSAPTPTNSLNTPNSSHNVDAQSQQHAQQQGNLTLSPTASAADYVPNAVFDGDLFVNPFATPSTESFVSSTQYALYGLKKAPRAWYDKLSTFLLQNGFSKGITDPTLFTRRFDDDILVLTDYGYHFNMIPIYCDSKSAIAISCNPVQHSKMTHIAVRYHFIKEHVEKGTIELYFVKTNYQLADIFTKALPVDIFNYLVRRLRMRSLCPQELDHLAKLQ